MDLGTSYSHIHITFDAFSSEGKSFFSTLHFVTCLSHSFSPQIPNSSPSLAATLFTCWNQWYSVSLLSWSFGLASELLKCKAPNCCTLCIYEQLMYTPTLLQRNSIMLKLLDMLRFVQEKTSTLCSSVFIAWRLTPVWCMDWGCSVEK